MARKNNPKEYSCEKGSYRVSMEEIITKGMKSTISND